VKDVLSGEVFSVKSKVVINAAGPFVDALLEQAYPDMPKLVCACAKSGGLKGRVHRSPSLGGGE
jgi:glycerol-3-phosphate dehydrogenase